MTLWFDNTHRQVLLLLKCCLLLPQPISELINPFVHGSHLQVALVQALSLLLQLRVLILVELVSQLWGHREVYMHAHLQQILSSEFNFVLLLNF